MTSRQVLAWLAGGAVVVIAWLARPFATGLLLGALMAGALGFDVANKRSRIANLGEATTLGRRHLAELLVRQALVLEHDAHRSVEDHDPLLEKLIETLSNRCRYRHG